MLVKGFNPELCHAEVRYGDEMGAAAGFRAVAASVYDGDTAPSFASARREAEAACWHDGGIDEATGRQRHLFTVDRKPGAFAAVGGVDPWRTLLQRVGRSGPFAAGGVGGQLAGWSPTPA